MTYMTVRSFNPVDLGGFLNANCQSVSDNNPLCKLMHVNIDDLDCDYKRWRVMGRGLF